MPKEFSGNPRNEGHRYEHRQENQSNSDDRRCDLGHCAFDRIPGRQLWVLLHNALDIFDDDNRIIDDNADRENDGEQGNGVGGVSDRVEHDEGADQADRNGQGWYQSRPQTAEKQIDHQHHQDERLDESLLDFVDCVGDKGRRVVSHSPCQIVREALLQFVQPTLYCLKRGDRICARCLVNGNCRGRGAVEPSFTIEIRGAQFQPRHVAEPENRTVRVGPDHDI